MKAPYHTRQQSDLLNYLKQKPGTHHTVAQLKEHLSGCGCSIGTATIYRQLDKLVEYGEVSKYIMGPGSSACYAYVGQENEPCQSYHCLCEKCGRLIHLDCDEISSLREHLLAHHDFVWNAGKTVFYGTCSACLKAESQPESE